MKHYLYISEKILGGANNTKKRNKQLESITRLNFKILVFPPQFFSCQFRKEGNFYKVAPLHMIAKN